MSIGNPALTLRGLELCAFSAGDSLLDIGCGEGAVVRLLRQQGYRAVGVDCGQRTVSPDFPFVQARADALPFGRTSLHGLICQCVLCLLEQPDKALNEFAAVCRPGARLLLADLFRKTPPDPQHPPLFSREGLETALLKTGWQVEHFEDHSPALKAFAARQLWYAAPDDHGPSQRWPWQDWGGRTCGYGLWIARKEASCTP